jgi:hypothetical protein
LVVTTTFFHQHHHDEVLRRDAIFPAAPDQTNIGVSFDPPVVSAASRKATVVRFETDLFPADIIILVEYDKNKSLAAAAESMAPE